MSAAFRFCVLWRERSFNCLVCPLMVSYLKSKISRAHLGSWKNKKHFFHQLLSYRILNVPLEARKNLRGIKIMLKFILLIKILFISIFLYSGTSTTQKWRIRISCHIWASYNINRPLCAVITIRNSTISGQRVYLPKFP